MRKAIFEWVSLILAVLVLGPFAGTLIARLQTADGSGQITAFNSTSPMVGIAYSLAALLLALIAGAVGSKTVTRPMGMVCAGFVLVWVACRSGTSEMIYRNVPSAAGAAWRMAIEAAVLAIPALCVVVLVQKPRPIESDDSVYPLAEVHGGLVQGLRDSLFQGRGAGIVLASAAGAALGCMLGSISLLKGQAVFSGTLAGIGAGCAGGLLMAGAEPRAALAPYIGVLLMAILGPVAGAVHYGSGLRTAAVTGDLIAISRLVPMDWIAGMFLGVPWGLSWVSGMVKEQIAVGAR